VRNISCILRKSTKILKRAGISTPRLDAEILLSYILKFDRAKLYYSDDIILDKRSLIEFFSLIKKRKKRKPLAYIIKRKEFFSFPLYIEEGVFIPRPETEILVEVILKKYKEKFNGEEVLIADICTGSANIAIALAKNIKTAKIYATDISDKALEIAEVNIKKFNLENRIFLIKGDLIKPLIERNLKFDIIVSNPPYVALNELYIVNSEIFYEPKEAILGGYDGLKYYKEFVKFLPKVIKTKYIVAFEINSLKAKEILKLFKKAKIFRKISLFKDYSKNLRVLLGEG